MKEANRESEGFLEKSISGIKNLPNSIRDTVTSKAYWVDTLAGQVFWAPVKIVNEVAVQEIMYGDGSTWDEVGRAQLASAGLNLLLARPIGKFRDYWMDRVFKVDKKSSRVRKISADLSLAGFLIPGLYTLSLKMAGESWTEVAQMVPTGSLIQMGLAFGYVKFLDKTREKFKTTPDYLLEEPELD
jgi:hypothetical protein